LLDRSLLPAFQSWLDGSTGKIRAERAERIDVAFGSDSAGWDGERVLKRYELLYEAGLVEEAVVDAGEEQGNLHGMAPIPGKPARAGEAMVLDHRRIVATALGRLRSKIRYRPVIFELLPEHFTLLTLQRAVEALAGLRLHKQNFRRLVEKGGLVEGTGRIEPHTGGRPAELFRFRRSVIRERRAPGVGLPALPGLQE
jgi:hypothetical protein